MTNLDARTGRRAGLLQRLHARTMATVGPEHDQVVRPYKQRLLGDLHGLVLEVGPGAGPNFAYYPPAVQWTGIEPNPFMDDYLREAAAQHGFTNPDLRQGTAEQLPLDDNSVDAVVTTLVLCSVRNPGKAVAEALRVLKPGGRYIFIEHVAAPKGSRTRLVQGLLKPLWKLAADGCNPDRETAHLIEQAGFSSVHIEPFQTALPVVGPHIAGYAVK